MIYKYTHWRVDEDGKLRRYMRGVSKWKPEPRGGATLCQIFDGKRLLAHGATECGDHSFSYKGGRSKAKWRANLALKLTLMMRE